MTNIPSATTWGSPAATKHALLIHGLTSSSLAWRRVASSLAAQGYFVTAPDLVGHGFRVPTTRDYRVSSLAQDLRPYLEARNHSLIIGHSLGALTALALAAHLPESHAMALVLVDPPLRISRETISSRLVKFFADTFADPKAAAAKVAENPLWDCQDVILRELGTRLCSIDVARDVLEQNDPWDFVGGFDDVSDACKVTVLIADPTLDTVCKIEELRPFPRVRLVVVPGAGHCIQNEFPDVVVEEAVKTVAELDTA